MDGVSEIVEEDVGISDRNMRVGGSIVKLEQS